MQLHSWRIAAARPAAAARRAALHARRRRRRLQAALPLVALDAGALRAHAAPAAHCAGRRPAPAQAPWAQALCQAS